MQRRPTAMAIVNPAIHFRRPEVGLVGDSSGVPECDSNATAAPFSSIIVSTSVAEIAGKYSTPEELIAFTLVHCDRETEWSRGPRSLEKSSVGISVTNS